MNNAKNLKGKNIFISNDYPTEILQKQKALRPLLKAARAIDPKSVIQDDQIKFKGTLYTRDSIQNIIDTSNIGLQENNNTIFFSGEYTPVSNFYHCKLSVENSTFNSAEQLYQFRRATSLQQPDIAREILKADTPYEALTIGRSIKSPPEWLQTTGIAVMSDTLNIKLQQVPKFSQLLKKHCGKKFIEASSHTFWAQEYLCHLPEQQSQQAGKDKTNWVNCFLN